LYNDDRYRNNKDAGYNIFYMGINVGAFICNFVAAYMRINYGWGWAFAVAGIGMIIGLIIFASGTRHIKHADVLKPTKPGDMSTGNILAAVLLPMLGFGVLGYMIPNNIFGTDTNDAFIFGCIPVIAFFIYLMLKSDKEDRGPIAALLSVYACIVVFWAVFHQNGDALTIWAEEYSDREMQSGVANIAETLGMAQTVNNHPSVAYDANTFSSYLQGLSVQKDSLTALGDKDGAKAIADEIKIRTDSHKYFENLQAEDKPAPGGDLKLYSTELYQSINPFWVVLLTPVVVGIFGFLRKRGKEPTTPTKIAIGLVITALSALVMVAAVQSTNLESAKASSLWLIASYGVITIGELCLSPMGLSLVSKLSPPRLTALMMGGFFLSTSFGNKLAGILSSNFETTDNKASFFFMNFILVMLAAVMLFLLLKWLNRVMREKGVS
jgi:POT family proton-dependent oligopeptide transporter